MASLKASFASVDSGIMNISLISITALSSLLSAAGGLGLSIALSATPSPGLGVLGSVPPDGVGVVASSTTLALDAAVLSPVPSSSAGAGESGSRSSSSSSPPMENEGMTAGTGVVALALLSPPAPVGAAGSALSSAAPDDGARARMGLSVTSMPPVSLFSVSNTSVSRFGCFFLAVMRAIRDRWRRASTIASFEDRSRSLRMCDDVSTIWLGKRYPSRLTSLHLNTCLTAGCLRSLSMNTIKSPSMAFFALRLMAPARSRSAPPPLPNAWWLCSSPSASSMENTRSLARYGAAASFLRSLYLQPIAPTSPTLDLLTLPPRVATRNRFPLWCLFRRGGSTPYSTMPCTNMCNCYRIVRWRELQSRDTHHLCATDEQPPADSRERNDHLEVAPKI
eukprot:m.515674 g.515674  ORF g.515674 m.515674 type:complete len:393 (-) comp21923_c0_seq14:2105-3283(-)